MSSPRDIRDRIDLNAVEMVFGSPTSPADRSAVHHVNERTTDPSDKLIDSETAHQTQPLLELDEERPAPPLAAPEIDDLEDPRAKTQEPYPGIDDGLLENNKNNKPDDHNGDEKPEDDVDGDPPLDLTEGLGTEDGKLDLVPYDEPDDGMNGLGWRLGGGDDRQTTTKSGSTIDMNTYQERKNLAQGMMDLALLSANANQLRYVLESSTAHPYYYPSLVFISLSIVFQIVVGIGLIMNNRCDHKDKEEIHAADNINNLTVAGIFLITIVNVFITSFSVATPHSIN